jgi:cellulose synthase operon protein C
MRKRWLCLATGFLFGSTLSGKTIDLAAGQFPRDVIHRFAIESGEEPKWPAYFDEQLRAEGLYAIGRYRAALYAAIALPPTLDSTALRARCLATLGEHDAALRLVEDDPHWRTRAEVLFQARRFDEVVRLLTQSPIDTDWPVRRLLGQSLEAIGDQDAAIEVYRSALAGEDSPVNVFRREQALGFDDAAQLTAAAWCAGRYAEMTLALADDPAIYDTVLAMMVGAYDVVDREYTPARLAAAELLVRRGNTAEAIDELKAFGAVNEHDPALNDLLGRIAADNRNRRGAREAMSLLRGVDPNSFRADIIDVRIKLLDREYAAANRLIDGLLSRRPADIEALSLRAALAALVSDEATLNATLDAVQAIDADNASAHALIGEVLQQAGFDFAGSIPFLQRAIDRAPWWVEPQHLLGEAHLSEADEASGRAVLERAAALDPYNVRTMNYLRVLDDLAGFRTFESDHFIFRYAEADHPIIPMFVAPGMDAMYERLTATFAFVPDRKPVVEVFPDAASFSVRTTGVPGVESFGASLGRVMTVVAPRAGKTLGPFNWARVLRHEFVHSLNLMQTRGRVPRWLTEGLAVWQEDVWFRFAWVPQRMYERATTRTMMTPQEAQFILNGGSGEGEIAYTSGSWIARWMHETHGIDSIRRLLDGYGRGLSDDEAFVHAIGKPIDAWFPAYQDWAANVVARWGYDPETQKRFDAMTKEAEQLTAANQLAEAATKWEAASALQPVNPTPARRLAGIYLKLNDREKAAARLREVLPLELQDNRFARRAAELYRDAGDVNAALEFARNAIEIDPYDPAAHDLIAALLKTAGREKEAVPHTEAAAVLRKSNSDDLAPTDRGAR